MTLKTILLIQSEPEVSATMTQALADGGFHVLTAPDTAPGVMAMYETHPDMVLLDEELPPVNGENLCSYIRRIFDIPIIVLVTTREGPASAQFLEMGADHCLAKPPSQRLLLARVNQLFWRYSRKPRYNFPPGIELDTEKHQVNLGDKIIKLNPTEFRLFSCLVLNWDRLVPYRELAIAGWGRQQVSPSSTKFYAYSLRKKLGDNGRRPFDLVNGRGIGFRFIVNHEP